MALNKLEEALKEGVTVAAKQYPDMAGTSLCHAPESFLQMKLVDAIHERNSYWVYPDISIGRICEEIHGSREGIDAAILSRRPDISVWYRNEIKLRSVIEIKRTWQISPIKSDINKIRKLIDSSDFINSGYVVGYWECKKDLENESLTNKFVDWGRRTDSKLICSIVGEIDDDARSRNGGYCSWGAAILRV